MTRVKCYIKGEEKIPKGEPKMQESKAVGKYDVSEGKELEHNTSSRESCIQARHEAIREFYPIEHKEGSDPTRHLSHQDHSRTPFP